MNQVTLSVTDVPRAKRFYCGLGLVPIVDGDDYVRLVAPGNEATLSLHRAGEAVSSSTVVYFEITELDARVEALQNDGFEFDEPPTDKRWLWREAHLTDPDGNRVCLFHAGDSRLNPPWRVPESKDRHLMSLERFEAWLGRYVDAWTTRDPEAAGALFSADALYFATPFDPPLHGHEDIVAYWNEQVSLQTEIEVSAKVIHVVDRTGTAKWRSSFRRLPGGEAVTLDGILEATFNSKGLATCFREWWHSQSSAEAMNNERNEK